MIKDEKSQQIKKDENFLDNNAASNRVGIKKPTQKNPPKKTQKKPPKKTH
jgi:hypothetical protein